MTPLLKIITISPCDYNVCEEFGRFFRHFGWIVYWVGNCWLSVCMELWLMLKAIACLVCKVVLCLSVFVISFPCFVGNKIFLHYLHIIIMPSFLLSTTCNLNYLGSGFYAGMNTFLKLTTDDNFVRLNYFAELSHCYIENYFNYIANALPCSLVFFLHFDLKYKC